MSLPAFTCLPLVAQWKRALYSSKLGKGNTLNGIIGSRNAAIARDLSGIAREAGGPPLQVVDETMPVLMVSVDRTIGN